MSKDKKPKKKPQAKFNTKRPIRPADRWEDGSFAAENTSMNPGVDFARASYRGENVKMNVVNVTHEDGKRERLVAQQPAMDGHDGTTGYNKEPKARAIMVTHEDGRRELQGNFPHRQIQINMQHQTGATGHKHNVNTDKHNKNIHKP